jgi:hypothetical protein
LSWPDVTHQCGQPSPMSGSHGAVNDWHDLTGFGPNGARPRLDSAMQRLACRHLWLSEGEHVRLGAGLEERDL